MTKFKHYIVTRFNVGLYSLLHGDPEEWFQERVKVFKEFTLPSIQKQTCQNFEWLLLFDAQTPFNHVYEIRKVIKDFPNTYSLFLQLPKAWIYKKYSETNSTLIDYTPLIEHIVPQSKYSLQTRLDNDDALMPDTIAKIQEFVLTTKDHYVIDIRHGYILDSVNKRAFKAVHPLGSPFLSLFQLNNEDFRAVYCMIHKQITRRCFARTINDRLWVMHVHGNNVSNRVFDWMAQERVPYDDILKLITLKQ
jgi:hypothetical protein